MTSAHVFLLFGRCNVWYHPRRIWTILRSWSSRCCNKRHWFLDTCLWRRIIFPTKFAIRKKCERKECVVQKDVYFTTNSPAIYFFSTNNRFKTKNSTEAIRTCLSSYRSGDPHSRRDCYVFLRRVSTDANSLSKPPHKKSWHCSSHAPPNCFLREFSEQQMDAISMRQLLFSFTNLLTLSPHFSHIPFPLLSFFGKQSKN